jgi:hypothetical protein
MRQVHFAWRAAEGRWRSGHATYEAELDARGLAFTPLGDAGEVRAVTFGAAVVTQGARALGRRAAIAPLATAATLSIDSGDFVEELESGDEGVHQQWRFRSRPPLPGDLEVRVPVSGGVYVEATAQGLHFSAGERLVRYGHALRAG